MEKSMGRSMGYRGEMAGVADVTDTDNMILMIANCYHFTICDIGITTRSCLDIVSVKLVQRAIDILPGERMIL